VAIPAPAVEGTKTGKQLFEREGFDEIVISAAIEPPDSVADSVTSADDQDWRVDALGSQLSAQFETVQSRQHKIQNDSVVVDCASLVESRGTVFGQIYDMLVFTQASQQEAADLRIVFDEQQSHAFDRTMTVPRRGCTVNSAKALTGCASPVG
jgi:hypothetical protein